MEVGAAATHVDSIAVGEVEDGAMQREAMKLGVVYGG